MASGKPIKISVLADVGKAVKDVTHFSDVVEENTHRVVTGLGDSKLTGGFGKLQEGFDVLDTRAMGFRDTITGVQDTMTGFQGLLGDRKPGQTFADSLLQVGMGVGDLASGMANFVVPLLAVSKGLGVATKAQAALNLVMYANPIGLVVLAIVALVAILVVAYQKSETFRNIVNSAFGAVWGVIRGGWEWIRSNWPALLAILTGPIGLAVRWIIQHWGQVTATIRGFPTAVRAVFSGIGGWLKDAGSRLIHGFIDGILGEFNAVRSTLGDLTSRLTSWKGPPERDRRLLRGSGRLIIGGLLEGMQDRYGDVQRSLGGLTGSLADTATGSVSVAPAAEPVWAQRLARLLEAGLRVTLESSGQRGDDALIELIRERVGAKGGQPGVLGIR
jgi:phage-related protein